MKEENLWDYIELGIVFEKLEDIGSNPDKSHIHGNGWASVLYVIDRFLDGLDAFNLKVTKEASIELVNFRKEISEHPQGTCLNKNEGHELLYITFQIHSAFMGETKIKSITSIPHKDKLKIHLDALKSLGESIRQADIRYKAICYPTWIDEYNKEIRKIKEEIKERAEFKELEEILYKEFPMEGATAFQTYGIQTADRIERMIKKLCSLFDETKGEDLQKDQEIKLEKYISNQELIKECRISFEGKDYSNAVFQACKLLEEKVREKSKSKPEEFGVKLISKAFNKVNGVLEIPSCKIDEEKDGLHSINRGIIQFHKNPQSHRKENIPENAIKIIGYIDYLLSVIDTAKIRNS